MRIILIKWNFAVIWWGESMLIQSFFFTSFFRMRQCFCIEWWWKVNRHNCRYWSDTIPHWMIEDHTQYPQKVNIRVFSTLIGSYFIDDNLNADRFETMLSNQIVLRRSLMIILMRHGFYKMEQVYITVYMYGLTWTQNFLIDGLGGEAQLNGLLDCRIYHLWTISSGII